MSAKELLKTLVGSVAPGMLNRRFIRLNTAKEPETMLLPLLCERGRLAVDGGANQGLYVHHLLAATDRVIAFESLPAMQETLRRLYAGRIALETVALSDKAGSAEIRMPEGHSPLATIEPSNRLAVSEAGRIEVHKIELRTLDSYALDDVSLIKIDVEGHEEAVLRGALATLKRCAPALVIEIEERHKAGAVGRVAEMLTGLGYAGFFMADGALHAIETFRADRDQAAGNVGINGKLGRYINNFVFVASAKAEAFKAGTRAILAGHAAA